MRYQLVKLASVWALALLMVGCGSEEEEGEVGGQDELELAGTYNGEITIANSNPFVSATTTLTLSSSGLVSGTTTGLPASGAPGEQGTLSGSIGGSDPPSVDFDLTFESTTLGRYTGTGKGVYAAQTNQLAAQMTGKKDGVFVGDFIVTLTKE